MLKLTRVDNWHNKLNDLIRERKDIPFSWGNNDCFNWAADAIETVTGHDIRPVSKGSYDSPIGGIRQLKAVYGCYQLKELFNGMFRTNHAAFARPGDIVFKNSNEYGYDCVLGVCNGYKSFFIFGDGRGLEPMPTLQLDGCWWIG